VQSYTNPMESAPSGITYTNGYDGNGNPIYSIDGTSDHVGTEQQYDSLNRLVKALQDHAGAASTHDTTTQYAYDTRDNLRSVIDPDSLTTSYTYDGLNNLTALGSPDYRVRDAAVQVIARLYWRWRGDGPIDITLGDALVTTLNDRVASIRRGAMAALGSLRYERSVQSLMDIVQHYEHGPDAQAAMFALARIAHPSSVALFNEALVGRDPFLKAAAIEGIARSGDMAQAPRLAQAAAGDKNSDVQLSAHFADAILSEGSINVLVDGLTKPALHNRALGLLSEVAPGRESTFAPQIPDPKPAIRADLLDALGISNDPDLLPQVERLLNDPDPMVARTATRAMFRLKGQGAPAARP